MSALIRIVLVCVLIFVLIRLKLNVGVVMLLASLALGLVFRVSPVAAFRALVAPEFLKDAAALVLSVWAIVWLETVLSTSGLFRKMAEAVGAAAGDARIAMACLPAILGFLPAAGGAYLSAPMVGAAAANGGYSPERKAFVNFWYRHVSEYVIPLFPAIIITARIARVSVRGLVLGNLILGAVAVLSGLPVLVGARASDRKAAREARVERRPREWLTALTASLPVTACVALVLAFDLEVWVAVACVSAGAMLALRVRPAMLLRGLNRQFLLDASLLVSGVLMFREVFDCAGAAAPLADIATAMHVSGTAVALLCAFLVAFATGVTATGVAVALPLAIALGVPSAAGGTALPLARAVYMASISGNILSPAHLCMLLTVKYFKADFLRVYSWLWAAQAPVVGAACLLLAASI